MLVPSAFTGLVASRTDSSLCSGTSEWSHSSLTTNPSRHSHNSTGCSSDDLVPAAEGSERVVGASDPELLGLFADGNWLASERKRPRVRNANGRGGAEDWDEAGAASRGAGD